MISGTTLIIAEAGVNHNGSLETAKKLIDVSKEAGADLVKFQTFQTEALLTKLASKADYQKEMAESKGSQFNMLKKLELDRAAHEELIQYCELKEVGFLSTAFDHKSIDLLTELNIPLYKIPSGEITNLPYLRHIGQMDKPVIMSTGMCTLEEVREAMGVLIEAGVKKNDLTILHCNTDYPTPMKDVNLKSMVTIRDELEGKVGYSDHTLGIEIPVAAVALGAKVIAIGTKPNGININYKCGSTYPKKMQLSVKKYKANIGISLDGDADRVIMSDEKGKIIDGDQIIAALAKRWKNKKMLRGGVIGTFMSNLLVN